MTDMIGSGLVQYHPDLGSLLVPIDDLVQHPDNPNNGDLDALTASIETNGMYRPVYAQRSTSHIVAGNTTWEACKTLGATEIPAVMLDIDDTHALRILLADNKTAALALVDPGLELAALEKLVEVDSLYGTGYAEHDLEALRRLAEPPEPVEEHFATWPTICVQVPPQTRRAYMTITETAGGDLERFHLLMRLAGWDPE
jgi:ParB-like chromosome segregation protein Spo0J